ncbi:MAG: nitroreductase [Muribaculaceae bacterium]|nr:nitroreductase [Muribaculaceae bacterium]
MTLQEAIKARHSVRAYLPKPLTEEDAAKIQEKIAEVNKISGLHIQLIENEPKAFKGIFAYGKFRGVVNYLVMAGKKTPELDELVGYYGERLVIYARTLGLDTCWVGLSYRKIPDTYTLREGEKVACYIAIGYGETHGIGHKTKTPEQVSNVSASTPSWFRNGVEAALLAPTAINQQKFKFEYMGVKDGVPQVRADKGFSLVGYTSMDLGIAKYNFEVGAYGTHFNWI